MLYDFPSHHVWFEFRITEFAAHPDFPLFIHFDDAV